MLYNDNNEHRRKSSATELQSSFKRMQSGSTTRSSTSNGASNSRRKSRWDQPETSHSTGSLLSSMERFVQTVDDMNETILVPCRLMDLQFDESNPITVPSTEKLGGHHGGYGNGSISGMGVGGSQRDGDRILSNLAGVDLFQFYSTLNNIKNDLMWGRKSSQSPSSATIPLMAPMTMTMTMNGGLSASSSAASVISTCTASSSAASMITSTCSSNASNNSAAASLSQVPASNPPQNSNGQGGGEVVKGHARRPSTVSTTSSTSASDTEFSELNEDSGVEAEHEDECSQSVADAFHHHLSGLQQCLCDLTIAADYVTSRYNNALGGL